MSKVIQIRNVSDTLHRRLRSRATLAGMSLSSYVRSELQRAAERVTPAELRARLAAAEPVAVHQQPAVAVRGVRDSR
jgi:antitoxin FitA